MKRIRVHTFGLLDFRNLFAAASREIIRCDRHGDCRLQRGEVELVLTEYARVSSSEHNLWNHARSQLRVDPASPKSGPRRRDPCPPGRDGCDAFERDAQKSSVINPFLEEATVDFVLFLERIVSPDDLIVIGNCMGAGVARVRAMTPQQRSRTVVVSWLDQPATNPYTSFRVAMCCTRYNVFDTLFAMLGVPQSEGDLGSEWASLAK